MTDIITSSKNPRVKQLIKLRDAKERRRSGLCIIDGFRETKQAIESGIELSELWGTQSTIDHFLSSQFSSVDSASDVSSLQSKCVRVSPEVFEQIAFGDRHDSIVAVARQPDRRLESLSLKLRRPKIITTTSDTYAKGVDIGSDKRGLVLVIDRVEKPGNLGAMLRTADAVGVSGVLLTDPICEIWNPNAIRSSVGAIFRVPLAVCDGKSAVEYLCQRNFQILAARLQAADVHLQVHASDKVAIVVGNEADGLGEVWQSDIIHGVRLPMLGGVDSLNVSVSASVLLYHFGDKLGWFSGS